VDWKIVQKGYHTVKFGIDHFLTNRFEQSKKRKLKIYFAMRKCGKRIDGIGKSIRPFSFSENKDWLNKNDLKLFFSIRKVLKFSFFISSQKSIGDSDFISHKRQVRRWNSRKEYIWIPRFFNFLRNAHTLAFAYQDNLHEEMESSQALITGIKKRRLVSAKVQAKAFGLFSLYFFGIKAIVG